MGLLSLLRRNKQQSVITPKLLHSQEEVYQAIRKANYPINGLALARRMDTDSASVTPRLSELVKKGRIKVAYQKRGLDNKRRNFYVVKADQ